MKTGKKRLSKAYTNEKGYTLVIAIVIMVVLLIVGTAVITVAANSLNTVNHRVDGRQVYYVAKSAMNVIDRSIQQGGLGNYVKKQAYQYLFDQPGKEMSSPRNLQISSVEIEGMEGISIEDMKISYKGGLNRLETEDGTIASSLKLLAVVISFTAKSGDQTYKIKAFYSYNGIVTQAIDGAVDWSEETWVNEGVSQ